MMTAFDALASSTSFSVIGPTAVWTKSTSAFLLSIWLSEVDDGFQRTLHVRLER